jgi:hypothetical protein
MGVGAAILEGSVRRAAIERLEAFAAELERLGIEDFRQMALSRTAADSRDGARREAERIAAEAGLTDLVTQARKTVRDYLLRTYGAQTYRPTWIALNWGLSLGSADDRIAAIQAVEDAATAVAVEGIAPPDVTEPLRAAFDLIARVHPLSSTADGALRVAPPVSDRNPILTIAAATFVIVVAVVTISVGLWPLAALLIVTATVVARSRARDRPDG